jgi:Flp pilus assembly protein TadD
LILLGAIWVVYAQVIHYDFINFDDGAYVTGNDQVKSGLTRKGFIWSLTSIHSANWHPLTWLSHMVDVEFHGLNAGGHHLTNVLFHMANTLFLFILLRRMTNTIWRSFMVAALFALHPLHVESVAWVAERKDVLSTFFGLLTLISYGRYSERLDRLWYFSALLFFMLSLMAKPMLVTLPFLMLLLDYWPLGRLNINRGFRLQPAGRVSALSFLLLEKIPLFILTAASCVVTYYAQKSGGALRQLDMIPLSSRFANAIVSYVAYAGKMFWPSQLSVIYPYPDSFAAWKVATGAAALIAIFIWVTAQIKKRPYLAVGWFWYVGTLVPVVGLVQVGEQAMADRYTYVPLVGLFMMIAWGAAELIGRWQHKRFWETVTAGALLTTLMLTSHTQVGYWANGVTLFSHALKITEDNALAHNNLSIILTEHGRYDEALYHANAAADLRPNNASVYNNLGYVFQKSHKFSEAIQNYRMAIKHYPAYTKAYYNLATTFMMIGNLDAAISNYRVALDLAPDSKDILNDVANAMVRKGRINESIAYYSKALRIDPNDADLYNNMGVALNHLGRFEESARHFRMALQLNPNFVDASENLAKALRAQQ